MIENGNISGRQVCMMLFEQGFLQGDDDYQALSSGRISAYDFMSSCISSKRITPAQLALQPCSGSCVITDPNNGNVLALVSYPSYDNNRMSGTIDADYYKQLNNDKSNPLYNWATQAQNAPGSTYKVCTSIMALDMGIINSSTSFTVVVHLIKLHLVQDAGYEAVMEQRQLQQPSGTHVTYSSIM